MPSTAYSAELRPDPVLRRFVLGTGAVLGLLGCIAVLTLPWPPLWRAIAAVTWAGSVSWEAARLRLAWRDCMAFRLGGDSTGGRRPGAPLGLDPPAFCIRSGLCRARARGVSEKSRLAPAPGDLASRWSAPVKLLTCSLVWKNLCFRPAGAYEERSLRNDVSE